MSDHRVLSGFGVGSVLSWVAVFYLATGTAGATCGATQCFLVTGTQEGTGARGRLTVDLSYRYVVQSRRLAGTDDVAEVLTPKVSFEEGLLEPDHHREIRTQNSLVQLDLTWGATDRLAIAASLPLRVERDHEHDDEVGTPDEHFTRDDGAQGFGDARIGVRLAFLAGPRSLLVGGLGLKLPTGQYRLRDGEGSINEPTLQPGSGSTDVVTSLYYALQIGEGASEAFASASHSLNRENSLDYAIGDVTTLALGVNRRTGRGATWSAQLNGRRGARDEFLGEAVPSTGSLLVNLTPGLRLAMGEAAVLYGYLQVPVYQRVNEAQLAPRTGLVLGVSRAW